MKGVMKFGKKGKLSPRYIGPYRISKRIGNVAYELELPQELAAVHSVFHVSMLKKCMGDPSLIIPTEDIGIKDSLSYEEISVQILDRQVRKLRTKEVASIKFLWRNQFVEEVTWEAEEDMKKIYPHLFEPGEIPDQVSQAKGLLGARNGSRVPTTSRLIMPPLRAVRGRRARRNVKEQGVPNAPEVQPQGEVTNVEFRDTIRMLSQVVTNQRGARQEEVEDPRVLEDESSKFHWFKHY
ncbi:hypothetical protein MTR67_047987 [Solanum verrucosum]|uniref:Tf2-1-like SH3-like domain-containing protein n=1 Tax=Solanum verrucosum TaxID=315347 RepID=A0AAF0ZW37_SOLVR|nr:hypothetical protein MTR67_047987 [Solanum verrucosum]